MTRQNRVLPTGEIVADPARGTLMGNRGVLHGADGRLGRARWRGKAWIVCRLEFRGRRRGVMTPGSYTELFFLDEAVALAAGHRPCAECRREDFRAFTEAWAAETGERPRAAAVDAVLHAARLDGRAQRRHRARLGTLPRGAFVHVSGVPCLWTGEALRAFSPAGYGERVIEPQGEVEVLTPAPTVAVLAAGYRPSLHASAA